MKKLILAFLLMAVSLPVFAATDGYSHAFTLGFGGVREDNSITKYHVVTADWQLAKYLELNGGDIYTGSPTSKSPFGVGWLGASLIDNEGLLYSSVGYVKLTHQTANLTSPFQFYLTFGFRYDGYSLSYRHISNAGTGGANLGEDLLVWAYTFGGPSE